jgi:hypothetical protein
MRLHTFRSRSQMYICGWASEKLGSQKSNDEKLATMPFIYITYIFIHSFLFIIFILDIFIVTVVNMEISLSCSQCLFVLLLYSFSLPLSLGRSVYTAITFIYFLSQNTHRRRRKKKKWHTAAVAAKELQPVPVDIVDRE